MVQTYREKTKNDCTVDRIFRFKGFTVCFGKLEQTQTTDAIIFSQVNGDGRPDESTNSVRRGLVLGLNISIQDETIFYDLTVRIILNKKGPHFFKHGPHYFKQVRIFLNTVRIFLNKKSAFFLNTKSAFWYLTITFIHFFDNISHVKICDFSRYFCRFLGSRTSWTIFV